MRVAQIAPLAESVPPNCTAGRRPTGRARPRGHVVCQRANGRLDFTGCTLAMQRFPDAHFVSISRNQRTPLSGPQPAGRHHSSRKLARSDAASKLIRGALRPIEAKAAAQVAAIIALGFRALRQPPVTGSTLKAPYRTGSSLRFAPHPMCAESLVFVGGATREPSPGYELAPWERVLSD
jgi:hypothetical protein